MAALVGALKLLDQVGSRSGTNEGQIMRKSSDNETAGTAGRRLQTQGTDRGSALGSERTSAPNGTPDGSADALPEARRPPRTPVRRACRVAVVDPDESVHLSVREALGNRANRCEVQGYRTPAALFARILAETPEVVLMEIGLPGTSGIDLTRRLKSLWPRLPVIMLTTRSDTGAIFRALMAGARGYLIKPVSVPELRRALACVLAGWPGLCPLAAKALVEGLQRAGAEARDQGFTPPRTNCDGVSVPGIGEQGNQRHDARRPGDRACLPEPYFRQAGRALPCSRAEPTAGLEPARPLKVFQTRGHWRSSSRRQEAPKSQAFAEEFHPPDTGSYETGHSSDGRVAPERGLGPAGSCPPAVGGRRGLAVLISIAFAVLVFWFFSARFSLSLNLLQALGAGVFLVLLTAGTFNLFLYVVGYWQELDSAGSEPLAERTQTPESVGEGEKATVGLMANGRTMTLAEVGRGVLTAPVPGSPRSGTAR